MSHTDPRILIIGAGMSGMLMAIRLLKAGITQFEIVEKAERPGGTWRENTYPGLQCDVPAYMYSYSFAPNTECSRRYATGSELDAYFSRVFRDYELAKYTRFSTEVTSAEYDQGQWTVMTHDGQVRVVDILITATGILHHPQMPDIAGLDTFAGVTMHSAQWRHDVPLHNKRVGVIGTGSTAVQIVSTIAEQVPKLSVFQRTAQWVVPALDQRYSTWRQPVLRRAPFLARLFAKGYEQLWEHTAGNLPSSKWVAPSFDLAARTFLRLSVKDKTLRRKLTPDYHAGCKRLVVADHFYTAIQRPNVELVTDAIERIEPQGVRTKDGRLHALDVLVLATGFRLQYGWPMRVVGRNGQTLDDAWKRGSYAYRSMTMPGFPNLFFMQGPHSPLGNFSIVTVGEVQADYLMQCIELFRQGKVSAMEPLAEPTKTFNARMKEAAKGTVWASGCQSWYLDQDGVPAIWPYSFTAYRETMAQPDWADFNITPVQTHRKQA